MNLATKNSAKPTLIYDGDCAFCTRSVSILQRWAKELVLIPSQSEGALELHPHLSREKTQSRVYLLKGKKLYGGAEAVARVLALRPCGGITLVYYFPPLRMLADALYDWVARHRHQFGCGDSCALKEK